MIRKRPRTVWCSPEERAAIRALARAAGMPVSRLVLDLAFSDAGGRDETALTVEETAELLDGFRMLMAFVRMTKGGTVAIGSSGGCRGNGIPVAEDTEKSGRLPAEPVRLSVSATEEEWAGIRERARRHGLSVSRYLVGLVLPVGGAPGSHGDPLPALSGVEQRELLEAARHMRSLLSGAEVGGGPAPVDSDHAGESPPASSGEEPSERVSVTRGSCAPGAVESSEQAGGKDAGPRAEPGPWKQGALF